MSRYLPRRPAKRDVVQRWLAFLRNQKEGIAAMDSFTVPQPRSASATPRSVLSASTSYVNVDHIDFNEDHPLDSSLSLREGRHEERTG